MCSEIRGDSGREKRNFYSYRSPNPRSQTQMRIGGRGFPASHDMVVHNDKWKRKATREYHKKHGTLPAGRGRGRGRGQVDNEPVPDQFDEAASENSDNEGSTAESGEEEGETSKEIRKERSKYARRKIESNAWRFESEEPDPYLGIHSLKLVTDDKSSTRRTWNHQNQTMRISLHGPFRQRSQYPMRISRLALDEGRNSLSRSQNWLP